MTSEQRNRPVKAHFSMLQQIVKRHCRLWRIMPVIISVQAEASRAGLGSHNSNHRTYVTYRGTRLHREPPRLKKRHTSKYTNHRNWRHACNIDGERWNNLYIKESLISLSRCNHYRRLARPLKMLYTSDTRIHTPMYLRKAGFAKVLVYWAGRTAMPYR